MTKATYFVGGVPPNLADKDQQRFLAIIFSICRSPLTSMVSRFAGMTAVPLAYGNGPSRQPLMSAADAVDGHRKIVDRG
jgi:hypothetical protein